MEGNLRESQLNDQEIKKELVASMGVQDDQANYPEIIQQLSEQLRLANEELLEIHDHNLELQKTERAKKEAEQEAQMNGQQQNDQQEQKESNSENVEQLKEDLDAVRKTMELEETKKQENIVEIIMLKEQNQQLQEKVNHLENQLLQLMKCFKAGDRIDSILQGNETDNNEDLGVTVGAGRVGFHLTTE